jgi:hypothetical protein
LNLTELPSDFSRSKERGFSFGASRDVYKRVYTKTRPFIPDPDLPGPGAYTVPTFVDQIANDHKNFIIGKKNTYEFRKFNS